MLIQIKISCPLYAVISSDIYLAFPCIWIFEQKIKDM